MCLTQKADAEIFDSLSMFCKDQSISVLRMCRSSAVDPRGRCPSGRHSSCDITAVMEKKKDKTAKSEIPTQAAEVWFFQFYNRHLSIENRA